MRARSQPTRLAPGASHTLAADHPRVAGARRSLERNFSAEHNPGRFEPDRAVLQDATYYYWTWAVSHALLALDVRQINTVEGHVDWPRALAEALVRRQQPDGSWINRYTDAREDDPLVATPWAAASLAICRSVLTGERKHLTRLDANTCRANSIAGL